MAGEPQPLTLRFPVGGLVRRYGYQAQAPFTTPDCANVWPIDTFERRERGGSRPGLTAIGETPGRVQCLLPLRINGRTLLFMASDGVPVCWEHDGEAWENATADPSGTLDTATKLHAAAIKQKVYVSNTDGAPHVFDPATGAVSTLTASEGSVPEDYPALCRYRGRLYLAGNGQQWFASRAGDPTDWDFFKYPLDAGQAMVGTCTRRDEIGQPVVALMPSGDDYLLFGCESSVWMMPADPLSGGAMWRISDEAGPVSSSAWCELPDRTIVFLAHSGLWLIPPGGNGVYEFSRENLPADLLGVEDDVSMVYDPANKGIHLSIVPDDASTGQHWWIDLRTKSFWPSEFGDDGLQPSAMACYAERIDGELRVLLGCVDGKIRYYDPSADDDDGEAIESHVLYGPFRAGSPFDQAMVREMVATLGLEGEAATWTVQAGDCGEQVVNDPVREATGTLAAGWNHVQIPRLSGGEFGIKIASSGRWAAESIGVIVAPAGKQRG